MTNLALSFGRLIDCSPFRTTIPQVCLPGMLQRNDRQEEISRAYVHAVAAHAGYLCEDTRRDYGIDIRVRSARRIGRRIQEYGCGVDIQVKSTTRPDRTETTLRYDLDVGNYNALVQRRGTPAILVVYCMPTHEFRWLRVRRQYWFLENCGYWVSLDGLPASSNPTKKRVELPLANMFDSDALKGIIRGICDE